MSVAPLAAPAAEAICFRPEWQAQPGRQGRCILPASSPACGVMAASGFLNSPLEPATCAPWYLLPPHEDRTDHHHHLRSQVLERYRQLGPDVSIIVAGDKKTPHTETRRFVESLHNAVYLSDEDQARSVTSLPKSSAGTKSCDATRVARSHPPATRRYHLH